MQWNANVEHQLSNHLAANVGYVGSKGTNLQNNKSLNIPRPGPGAIQAARPYPQYANVNMFCACFPSDYKALQTKLQGRWGASSLLASYTLSKSTDILSSFYGGGSIQNWYDLEDSRGPSNFDRRHSVVVSFTGDLPFGTGKRFLSGSRRARESAGEPLAGEHRRSNGDRQSADDHCCRSTTATPARLPIGRMSCPASIRFQPNQGPANWINPAAFVAPPQFTYGNAGRNSVTGPGRSQFDLSLIRNVPLPGQAVPAAVRGVQPVQPHELLQSGHVAGNRAVRQDLPGRGRPEHPVWRAVHLLTRAVGVRRVLRKRHA